ncbi:MAG TPA: zf-HC2 domain-containing protein [Patescibacteria group bacterium]|nr:zf-HC2 domain-containing protein [Patescibacteria group bacterium]
MSCKTYKPMLHSYINDELNFIEKTELERHLLECAECRKEEEEIKKLKRILSAVKPDKLPFIEFKENIMAAIKVTAKARAAAYDIKVLGRLGASLIACGILVFLLNFSTFGNNLEAGGNRMNIDMQGIGQKVSQPLGFINEGLANMSSKLVNLNGITFRLEQKIRGGM